MLPEWAPKAEFLLRQRDRFTQQQVREEFARICSADASLLSSLSLEFDPDRKGYLTPVADRRYSVIWYLENATAVVRAVVPTTRFDTSTDDLKERVALAVHRESDGAVALD